MLSDGKSSKTRRRTAGKTDPPQDGRPVKLTLSLPGELARRFGVHAEMEGCSKSELFARLVRHGCRRYVVHDHEREAGATTPEASVNVA